MATLGVDAEEYEEIVDLMFTHQVDTLKRRKPEELFVEYCIDQRRNIKDLNELVDELNEKTQYNAIVGAIRLRSEIQDKMIAKGQEFGLIRKTPEQRLVLNGYVVADMTETDLKKAITKDLSALGDMMDKFGDQDMASLPAKPMYYGPKLLVETTATVASEPLKSKKVDKKAKKRPKAA
jgi:hypothetical protein